MIKIVERGQIVKKHKATAVLFLIFFIFSAIQSCCLLHGGDDIWWFALSSPAKLFGEQNINGRYFTNVITYYIANYTILRCILCTIMLFLLFVLLGRVLHRSDSDPFRCYALSALTIFTLPVMISYLTTNWISGITNYLISMIFTLLFIDFIKPLFFGELKQHRPVWCIYTFAVGAVGALCLENITLYNICLGIFVIVYSLVRFKKVRPADIAYLIGTAAGAAIMFLNSNYSSLAAGNDDVAGKRSIDLSFSDVFFKLYREIINLYAKPAYLAHLLIAAVICILFIRKYGSISSKDAPKYAKLFLPVIIIYAVYSFFTYNVANFVAITAALRIRAIETALVFFYIIALLYMTWFLLSKNSFTRFAFFLISTVIVTAPFAAVDPITPRCFFATYLFWCLAAGELLVSLSCIDFHINAAAAGTVKRVIVGAIGFFALCIGYIDISNKTVDNLRKSYIKQQFEEN